MVKNPGQADYLRESRLWYPEGEAPFGELNLVRADHDMKFNIQNGRLHPNLYIMSQGASIVIQAWANSEWLHKDIKKSEQSITNVESKLEDRFGDDLGRYVIDAAYHPAKQSAWFAIKPPERVAKGDGIRKGLASHLSSAQFVGIGTAKHDVSGSKSARLWKQFRHPEKVYAKTGDIDVIDSERGKKIGTALHFVGLGLFGPDQRPTTYTSTSNELVLNYLQDLGYQITATEPKKLIDGITFDQARLMAPSVHEVRGRMLEEDDWLKNYQPVAAPVESA